MVAPKPGDNALRAQLADFLDWDQAHVSFDTAVKDLATDLRRAVPAGFAHSAWQILEHIRITQADILDFCVNAKYEELKWPDDYWPRSPVPSGGAAWHESIAAVRRDRQAMQELARNPAIDLFAKIPWGSGQTYIREILLVADHAAYHVAQIVDVRRALGIWTG